MNNVKLAFERYMDFLTVKRRDSMLRWSLELPGIILENTVTDAKNPNGSSTWRQSIITPNLFRKLMHPQLRNMNLVTLKKQLRLVKRDFTSTTTKFFDNNFDMIVDNDTTDIEVLEKSISRYEELMEELKYFNNNEPESFTPDIIAKVSKLFDWLYLNKQLDLAYKLIKRISPNYRVFFKFNQYNKMVEVIDRYGNPNDLFQFCEVFKYEKLPNIWRKVERLKNDRSIRQLIELSAVRTFSEASLLIGNILQDKSSSEGLKYFTFRVCSSLYKNFDLESRGLLYTHLMELDTQFLKYFPPALISRLFITYSELHPNDLTSQYEFLEKFIKPHYTVNDINEESFQYKLISSLPKDPFSILRFKVWFNYCFNDERLRYDMDIPSIIYLRNNKLHYIPKKYVEFLDSNPKKLSTALSVLIYTHAKYENNSKLGQMYFQLKNKLSLEINKVDKIGYLQLLTNSKQYSKAGLYLGKCLQEDSEFESDETLGPILIILAKTKNWGKLEDIYEERYENNEAITKDQYITLFLVLSLRPGTDKIMFKLWENYLKRGFEPNDHILSSIINGYINNKSYEEALKWFTAYSHYKVQLTSRSYGLMLNSLACLRSFDSVFKVLDELVNKDIRLPKAIFIPVFIQLAEIGDYKSIELILTKYYPKLNLPVERDDSRWIMQCHYHAQRFNLIIDNYLKMDANEIVYKDSLLALETAIKFRDVNTFEVVWDKAFKFHFKRRDLDIKAYIFYMAYWIRKYGAFGIQMKINQMKETIEVKELPAILFNQMIFSGLRTHRPWLTKKLVRIALSNNVIPSSKTYSLILQSNVCMPWVARNSIDETINLLEEVLNNRKEDRFGKLNEDINPMSLKMVIKAVMKYKNVYEARRLFELYVEVSRDNLTDNIHILNTELMLLGEEERWIEFDSCYDRYIQKITQLHNQARLKDSSLIDRYDEVGEFNRLDVLKDINLRSRYDEYKISDVKDARVKIPNWVKKSHYDVWIYRVKQLEVAERLGEVNDIVADLIGKGIVFSNKNLNETALFLSERGALLEEAASFIDNFLLPYHIENRQFKMMKLRYRTDQIPGLMKQPKYGFNNDTYFKVMKNLSQNIMERLTEEQRENFLSNISVSSKKYILKNVEQITRERRHIRSSYLQTKRLRTVFYRNIRSRMKIQSMRMKKHMGTWKVDRVIDYRGRMEQLKEEMVYIVRRIHDRELPGRDSEGSRSRPLSRKEIGDLRERKREVRGRMNRLRRERDEKLEEIMQEEARMNREKAVKVGKIDLTKL